MTAEELQSKTKEEMFNFIREKLAFKDNIQGQLKNTNPDDFIKEHRRFEMSGYEGRTGQCTLQNLAIVNEFAELGIYDYTSYLFLDFYKGTGTLYYQYFGDNSHQIEDFSGYGTTEIIYEIFQKTIFSKKPTRRRS
jgi:hypothetical protein